MTVTDQHDIFELREGRNISKIQRVLSLIDLWYDVSEDLDIVGAFESLCHYKGFDANLLQTVLEFVLLKGGVNIDQYQICARCRKLKQSPLGLIG